MQVTSNLILGKADKESAVNQAKIAEGLQKQFRSRYDDTLKKA